MSGKAARIVLPLVLLLAGVVIAGCGTTTHTITKTVTVPKATTKASGGRGGGITSEGSSGGPWPGNDYPSALANAPQDSTEDPFGEDNRECVSYVAETLDIAFGYKLPFYGGNAVDWLNSATKANVPSGTTPTQYSIAYSAANDHVALVVAVTGSGSNTQVTVEQYNQHLNGTYSWDVEPATDFDHYIYFLPQSRPGAQASATTTSPASGSGTGASSTSSAPPQTVTVTSPPQPSGQLTTTTASGSGLGNNTSNPQVTSSPQATTSNPQPSTSNPQSGAPSPQNNGGHGSGSTNTKTTSTPPPPTTTVPVPTTTAAAPPPTTTAAAPPPTTTAAPPAPTSYSEIAGSIAHTWSDPYSAGGSPGQVIQSQQAVQVSCVITNGFAVADGNQNWYRLSGDPWDENYYVSADAFYNGASPGGSLSGTPWVDGAVPSC